MSYEENEKYRSLEPKDVIMSQKLLPKLSTRNTDSHLHNNIDVGCNSFSMIQSCFDTNSSSTSQTSPMELFYRSNGRNVRVEKGQSDGDDESWRRFGIRRRKSLLIEDEQSVTLQLRSTRKSIKFLTTLHT